jgi:Xaa-Pro aminopeptidase
MSSLALLREKMREAELPALIVSDPTNLGWLTGFSGSFGRAVVTPDKAVFVTDSRYTLQAGEEVKGMPVTTFANPVNGEEFLAKQVESLAVKRAGFEAANTSYAYFEKLKEKFDGIELVPAKDFFEELRKKKSEDELAKIREACGIADAAWTHIQRMVQPGVSEYDLMLDLEFFIRRSGADVAFPSIVVSGERSARPHGHPSEKKLENGDFVTFDFGAKVDGYNSDMTRTVVVGEASERHREVYNQVLKAQLAAIDAMKPGVPAKDVDALSRKILDEKNLAQYFGHGLGHGLGKLVHDGGRLAPVSEDVLAPGQVWTVEPGVLYRRLRGSEDRRRRSCY